MTSSNHPPLKQPVSEANVARPLTPTEGLLTAAQVARILQISRSMVYYLVRRGDLPSAKIGRLRRIHRDDVQEYLRRHSGPPMPQARTQCPTGSGNVQIPHDQH